MNECGGLGKGSGQFIMFANTISELAGLLLYCTVTLKLQEAVLPSDEVTTKVLMVVPIGNEDPLG
jgi:hypothetical protein